MTALYFRQHDKGVLVPQLTVEPISATDSTSGPRSVLLSCAMVATAGAIYFAFLTPSAISLSVRIFGLDPEGKALGLSNVVLIGSIVSVLVLPLFGALSDRTRSRFGRRRPWLVGGALVTAAGGAIMGAADGVAAVTMGWAVSQLGLSAVLAAFLALVPEMVPERHRARVSAGIGIVTSLAVLGGIAFASNSISTPMIMMVLPALVGATGVLLLAAIIGNAEAMVEEATPRSAGRSLIRSFVAPFSGRDFTLNWVSRFLFGVSVTGMMTYAVYFLTDAVGLSLEAATAEYTRMNSITLLISVACFAVAGLLSDKTGRRKIFVVSAALVVAAAFVVAALTQSQLGFLIALIIYSAGQAIYLTVDIAIAAAVIPDPQQAANAMAVYQVATTAPGLVVPLLGAAMLASGSYVAFFIMLGGMSVLASLTILFVRVR